MTGGRLLYSVPEAARMLGVSAELAYRLVADGELPSVVLTGQDMAPGTRGPRRAVKVPADALSTYLGQLQRRSEAARRACKGCRSRAVEPGQDWCQACETSGEAKRFRAAERERERKREWWAANGVEARQRAKAKARAKRAGKAAG